MAYSGDDEEGFVIWHYVKIKFHAWKLKREINKLRKKVIRAKRK